MGLVYTSLLKRTDRANVVLLFVCFEAPKCFMFEMKEQFEDLKAGLKV